MTRSVSKFAITALVAFGTAAAAAQGSHPQCSASTIEGDYSFRVSGELFTAGGIVNRDGIALTHFDGDHLLTQVDYVLADGVATPGPKDANGFNTNETGTYSVHDNCTGEAEIDFPTPTGGTSGAVIKFLFVISDHGRQLTTIVTSLTPPNSSTPVPANIHSDAVKVP
jgi:hypothetical protein